MKSENRYWMVHGLGPANAIHTTYDSAKREAQRLARCAPGTTFFVLEAVRAFRKVDVEEIEISGEASSATFFDEVPFE